MNIVCYYTKHRNRCPIKKNNTIPINGVNSTQYPYLLNSHNTDMPHISRDSKFPKMSEYDIKTVPRTVLACSAYVLCQMLHIFGNRSKPAKSIRNIIKQQNAPDAHKAIMISLNFFICNPFYTEYTCTLYVEYRKHIGPANMRNYAQYRYEKKHFL